MKFEFHLEEVSQQKFPIDAIVLSGIVEERAFNGVNNTPRGPGRERFQDALAVGQMRRLQNDSIVYVQMLVRDANPTKGPFNDLVVCYLMEPISVGKNENLTVIKEPGAIMVSSSSIMERSKEMFREYPEYPTVVPNEKLRMARACLELVSVPGMLTDDTVRKCDSPNTCWSGGNNWHTFRATEKKGRRPHVFASENDGKKGGDTTALRPVTVADSKPVQPRASKKAKKDASS
jgi:hypothetical protein